MLLCGDVQVAAVVWNCSAFARRAEIESKPSLHATFFRPSSSSLELKTLPTTCGLFSVTGSVGFYVATADQRAFFSVNFVGSANLPVEALHAFAVLVKRRFPRETFSLSATGLAVLYHAVHCCVVVCWVRKKERLFSCCWCPEWKCCWRN